MKKYKFQVITFRDHHHNNSEWVNPEITKPKPLVLEYTGWVTSEDEERLILSQGRDKESPVEYSEHMTIEKNCIIKRKTIKGL